MSEDINRSESGASITLSKSFRVEDGLVIEEILSAADAAAVAGSASIELDQQQDMIQRNKNAKNEKKSFGLWKCTSIKDGTVPNNNSNQEIGKIIPTKATNQTIESISDKDENDHENSNGDDDELLTIVEMPSPADIIVGKEATTTTAASELTTKSEIEFCKLDRHHNCKHPGMHSTCKHSLYSHPKSIPELETFFDFNGNNGGGSGSSSSDYDLNNKQDLWKDGGLVWYSTIVPNDYNKKYKTRKSLKMLPKKYYDEVNECIKPRRPNLAVKEDDFFQSLVKINIKPHVNDDSVSDGGSIDGKDFHDGDENDQGGADNDADFKVFDKITIFDDTNHDYYHERKRKTQYSRWIFSGVLNGFPGLKHLELVKIEYKATLVPRWRTHWHTEHNPKDLKPTYPKSIMGLTEVRAKLREPGWSAEGWSKDSPGYVLYYQPPETRKVPRTLYGTNIIKQFEEERFERSKGLGWHRQLQPSPKCVKIHMISHRYATLNEKWKDKITYHSFAFLEWDHGLHCTVIELAYLNGLGGYNGRCNHIMVSLILKPIFSFGTKTHHIKLLYHLQDRDEPVTTLFNSFPPEMVKPWKSKFLNASYFSSQICD